MDRAFAHVRQCWGADTLNRGSGAQGRRQSFRPRKPQQNDRPGTRTKQPPPPPSPPRQPTQTHLEGHQRAGCRKVASTTTTSGWAHGPGQATAAPRAAPPVGHPWQQPLRRARSVGTRTTADAIRALQVAAHLQSPHTTTEEPDPVAAAPNKATTPHEQATVAAPSSAPHRPSLPQPPEALNTVATRPQPGSPPPPRDQNVAPAGSNSAATAPPELHRSHHPVVFHAAASAPAQPSRPCRCAPTPA